MIPGGRRPPWFGRYGVALLVTALFVGIELTFEPELSPRVFLLLFPPVIISSLYGGFGPGILSGVISVAAANLFHYPPYGRLELSSEGFLQLTIFFGTTLLLGFASEAMRGTLESLDRSNRKSREELLTARKLAAIIETSTDAITSKNLDGIITAWNGAAERIYGYPAEEAIGKNIAMLVPPEAENDQPKILERIRRGERLEHYEALRRRRDGRRIVVSLAISPLIDEEGRVVGASTIARDVTEKKKAEQEREALLQKAQDASRAREDVLAVVSHDLRNPLSVVLMTARMLKDGSLPKDKIPGALERQIRAVKQAESLVVDLLEVSKAEAGHIELDRRPVAPRMLLERVKESQEAAAEASGATLKLAPDPGLPPVLVDLERASRILSNLLSNAIKFTPKGGLIQVRAEPAGEQVVFSVSDTGPGIDEEGQARIFDRFWQARGGGAGGYGLGLPICKGLTEAHGGRIWVESRPGQGSTFFFSLPVAAEAEPKKKQGSPKLHASPK